jgi:polyhydroxyalkanoate synthesis regulator protein
MAMFEDAAQAFSGKAKAEPKASGNASEVDELKAELDALRAKVDKLSR